MKLEPLTKLDKRITATSKNLTITSCRQIMAALSFFQFMANLEQFGNQIPNDCQISLILTFYLIKTVSKTLKSLKQLSYYCFE